MVDILGIEHNKVAINPMKAKKTLPSAPDWTKTPVWREANGEIVVDSTPIMKFIDQKYNIARKRVKKDGRKPKQLWHDLLNEFLGSFNGMNFFGGDSQDMIDLVAFGYVSSIEPYPQFSQVADHKAGMVWFNAMKEASKA